MQTGTRSSVALVELMDKSSTPGRLSVSNESSSPSSSLCSHRLAKSLESFEKQLVACLQPWIVFALQRQHLAGGRNLAEAQRHYHDNVISDIEQGLSPSSRDLLPHCQTRVVKVLAWCLKCVQGRLNLFADGQTHANGGQVF